MPDLRFLSKEPLFSLGNFFKKLKVFDINFGDLRKA